MPFFSIITINFNNAAGLQITIDSVLQQSFKDFEFLIIDGGSTDGSIKVFDANKSGIHYFISEKDSGIYNAMNKGITRATGKYLLFLNSGDILADNEVLQKVASTNPFQDLVYGNMLIKDKNKSIRQGIMPDKLTHLHLLRDTLWHPVTFISRFAINDFGYYDEGFKIAADYDSFLYLILKRKSSYIHLPFNISVFANTGISANPANKVLLADERLRAQKRYFNPLLLSLFRLYSFIRGKWFQ
jgi:glycosyltransferase involved in cell wall biosynthesis